MKFELPARYLEIMKLPTKERYKPVANEIVELLAEGMSLEFILWIANRLLNDEVK